ncbi:MAG: HDIG domain-containing protein [Anaerolineae bacterium]|nr:HDIG domain-containing protein [Anaerolineae bacterium]
MAVEILPLAARPTTFALEKGQVAPQDIQAPYSMSYTSVVLTNKKKTEAETAVSPVYLPADPAISRQQIEKLRLNLNYINTVRADAYATPEQKLSDLAALQDILIGSSTAQLILSLDDTRWQMLQQESLRVLEQAMRSTIRSDRIRETQRNIPTLVSFALPVDLASVVVEFVTPFIVPNSLYSEELTQKAREEARNNVKPVTKSYLIGETIIEKGRVVNDETFEALQAYQLNRPQDSFLRVLSTLILVSLLCVFTTLYLKRRENTLYRDVRSQLMISVLFVVFLAGARYLIPNTTIIPYLYPLPAFSLTIACLLNAETAAVFSIILSILSAFGIDGKPDFILFFIFTNLAGIIALGKGQRIANFFWAGIATGTVGCAVVLISRLGDPSTDVQGMATLCGAAMINGLAAASLALLFQFLLANLLGLTTALRLLDISRPNHPLLLFILTNAPGTYQHSLQVANLAEQAADAIGADALLVRVGALYHDAGKAANPQYFIENQMPGATNPHDMMDPVVSSATIIQHVYDGVALAKKHRLPKRIQDFVLEHHGTLLTRYQYAKALEAQGNNPDLVDKEIFRYPGPAPQSKETALLMLADGCEAKARAEHPANASDLRMLVKGIFEYLLREGQLDNTSLTFKELHLITESFVTTLQNAHHPRLKYPDLAATEQKTEAVKQSMPTETTSLTK